MGFGETLRDIFGNDEAAGWGRPAVPGEDRVRELSEIVRGIDHAPSHADADASFSIAVAAMAIDRVLGPHPRGPAGILDGSRPGAEGFRKAMLGLAAEGGLDGFDDRREQSSLLISRSGLDQASAASAIAASDSMHFQLSSGDGDAAVKRASESMKWADCRDFGTPVFPTVTDADREALEKWRSAGSSGDRRVDVALSVHAATYPHAFEKDDAAFSAGRLRAVADMRKDPSMSPLEGVGRAEGHVREIRIASVMMSAGGSSGIGTSVSDAISSGGSLSRMPAEDQIELDRRISSFGDGSFAKVRAANAIGEMETAVRSKDVGLAVAARSSGASL